MDSEHKVVANENDLNDGWQSDRHHVSTTVTKKKKKKKKGAKKVTPTQLREVFVYPDADRGTFRVTTNQTAGRCIVAARDLEVGELILEEPPFAKVIRQEMASRHCACCCQEISQDGQVPSATMYHTYCSKSCKEKEEQLAADESGALGKVASTSSLTDVDLDLLRMMIRLVVTRARALRVGTNILSDNAKVTEDSEVAGQRSFLYQQWQNLVSLMHHRDDMPATWIAAVRAAADTVMPLLPEWCRCDVDEAVELACRVNVNAHGLRDNSGSNLVVGIGMFPLTAMLNHSCSPNCNFVYCGGKMSLRVMEAVGAGTELTVFYIDLLQSTAARRRQLLASKYFLCSCARCTKPSSADDVLDALCCGDCGVEGVMTDVAPSSLEDDLATQLSFIGHDAGDVRAGAQGVAQVANGRKRGKSKSKNESQPVSDFSSHARGAGSKDTAAPAVRRGNMSAENILAIPDVWYCSSCGRASASATVDAAVAGAKSAWDSVLTTLKTKQFEVARKQMERWFKDYEAGAAPSTNTRKPSKKGNPVALKLHPRNAMVVQALISLANCCNALEDHLASSRYLDRAIKAMETVFPSNFPELGDFYAALGEALANLLESARGQSLPRKMRGQVASDRKQAFMRSAAIRSACLGQEHPTTKQALRAASRT